MSQVFTAIAAGLAVAGTGGAAAAGAVAATSATAATTATAATAATTAAATGAKLVTLSNVLSAGSALAAIGQGFAARSRLRTEAAFAKTEAVQEEAAGAAQARDLAREYRELAGEQQVIQLANGLDIGVGTPVNIADATTAMADRNLDMTRRNAGNRASMARLRSRGLMAEGRAAMISGFGQAAQIGANQYRVTG